MAIDQGTPDALAVLLGTGPQMRDLGRSLREAYATGRPVLIAGEPGIGHAGIARALHDTGDRRAEPFTEVGRMIAASLQARGTLFLRLPHSNSAADPREVARDLARPTQVRLIVGLEAAVAAAEVAEIFAGSSFVIPPLRERIDEIPWLIGQAMARKCRARSERSRKMTASAAAVLAAHRWPGNLDELERVIKDALVKNGPVDLESLPDEFSSLRGLVDVRHLGHLSYREFLATLRELLTREYLIELMRRHRGSVTQAAAQAAIERESLHRLLKRHRIRADDFRV